MTPLERIRLYNAPLLCVTDMTLILGVSRKVLHRRLEYGSPLAPQPYQRMSIGNVWRKEDVERWLTQEYVHLMNSHWTFKKQAKRQKNNLTSSPQAMP